MTKKETKVEKVEVGGPVEFSTTIPAKLVEESVEVAPVKVSVDLVNVEKYLAKIAELETTLANTESVARDNERFLIEKLELAKKEAVVQLTSEQKAALEHCFKWLKVFVSKSGSVEFRRDTKEALATLSTLL